MIYPIPPQIPPHTQSGCLSNRNHLHFTHARTHMHTRTTHLYMRHKFIHAFDFDNKSKSTP